MKKRISILVLMVLIVVGGTFALDMSVGGGALFDFSGNNGVEASGGGASMYFGLRNMSFGAFGFLDLTYAEIDLSFAYGSMTSVTDNSGIGGGMDGTSTDDAGSVIQLSFSVLGKYPIDLGGFTIFPLLGLSYNMVTSYEDENGNSASNPGDLSQFGILGGVGADFGIGDSLFFRAEALFHLRIPSKVMIDMTDTITAAVDKGPTFGMGPRLKVAIGYKL